MSYKGSKAELSMKIFLYLVFAVAAVTGLNVILGGGLAIPEVSGVEATVDNELRFFAVIWLGYGAFCFWVAKRFEDYHFFIPGIALVFFLGGFARLMSVFSVGLPSLLLIPPMVLELALPPVIYILYKQYRALALAQ